MTYSVRHKDEPRDGFGPYRYEILDGDRLIATYSHDYRGDDHWIEFENGPTDQWPVGKMTDVLKGGGPQPLTLSAAAIKYIKDKQTQDQENTQQEHAGQKPTRARVVFSLMLDVRQER